MRIWMHRLFLFALCILCFDASAKEKDPPKNLKILIGSPIRQKTAILKEFLESLDRLEHKNATVDYFFVDDNEVEESRALLKQFAQVKGKKCLVLPVPEAGKDSKFICDETTHHWNESLVWKVASFKDQMIQKALNEDFDYLFLIDSDIVLHPKTLDQLVSANKDIISNIFWTCWYPNAQLLPQVWLSDHYTQFEHGIGEQVSQDEAQKRHRAFIEKMQQPGTYEVGGLCACTLISKNALKKNVSFRKIHNLKFWGEDRHFCIRAAALGLSLHVDTHYPSYHIYRETDLAGVEEYKNGCSEITPSPHKLTLSMIVRNEGDRYLRRVLEAAKEYITDAVIIDDHSTDNTVAVCEEVLKGIPHRIIKNTHSKFIINEVELRKQQWEETVKMNPEWILSLDADQIFETSFKDNVQRLLSAKDTDIYYFRWFDLWDEEHYRDDKFWCGHKNFYPMIVRYKKDIEYKWKETPLHCGHFPLTVLQFPGKTSELRVKHYGWAKPEYRAEKAARYQKLDPESKYGWKGQYDSILDEHPNLVAWVE